MFLWREQDMILFVEVVQFYFQLFQTTTYNVLHLKQLLNGVPTNQQKSIVSSYLETAWSASRENLEIAADRNNPLAQTAFNELLEAQRISAEVLESDVLPVGYIARNIATMFGQLDIKGRMALVKWATKRS